MENGDYLAPTEKIISVKYETEVRICLDMASTKMPDGSIVGTWAEMIDYTRASIISGDECKNKICVR